jgi:hypothetical protein
VTTSGPGDARPRTLSSAVIAVGALLVGGVVLILVIVAGLPLVLSPLIGVAVIAAALVRARRRLSPGAWQRLLARVRALAVVAVAATLAYDVMRAVLAGIDPSPYNPFEVVRVFGQLMIGASAPTTAVFVAGWTYHLFNGVCFGIAFGLLFLRGGALSTRWAVARGIGWGLFLESIQLALYPGWVHIQWLAEFTTISIAAHLTYGVTLGFGGSSALRRLSRPAAGSWTR